MSLLSLTSESSDVFMKFGTYGRQVRTYREMAQHFESEITSVLCGMQHKMCSFVYCLRNCRCVCRSVIPGTLCVCVCVCVCVCSPLDCCVQPLTYLSGSGRAGLTLGGRRGRWTSRILSEVVEFSNTKSSGARDSETLS